jgi:hypothetical protein
LGVISAPSHALATRKTEPDLLSDDAITRGEFVIESCRHFMGVNPTRRKTHRDAVVVHTKSKREFKKSRTPCVWGFVEIGSKVEYWWPPR